MTLLKRIGPRPGLTLILAGFWVLLNNRFTAGVLAAGLLVGLVVAVLTDRFWPKPAPSPPRPLLLLRLTGRLLGDIVRANLTVAALVLRWWHHPRSAFVAYPLRLRAAVPVTVLSSIISLTPGTVTVDVDRAEGVLWIHCLDLEDEQVLIDRIHNRYERLLEEIFP